MTIEQLLETLDAANIKLGLADGELKALDPDGKLTTDILASLRQHKLALIAMLEPSSTITPSDFPNAASNLTQEFLDQLQSSMPGLERLYLATPMQRGLIFHSLLDEAGAMYTGQMYGDLVGPIDQHAFQRSWDVIVGRHDIFRTAFVGFDQDAIHQAVARDAHFRIGFEDWRHRSMAASLEDALKAFRFEDKSRGFDFNRPPLMRFTLIRIEDERYHFVWSHHHLLTDGWCLAIIFKELFAVYASNLIGDELLLPTPAPFEMFVSWLREQDEDAASHFWQEYMEGFDTATPIVLGRAARRNVETGPRQVQAHLSEDLSKALFTLARNSRCTINTVVQAAWAYLLHRYSGESDIVFGATVSGRPPEIDGIETMVGLFINTVPVRVRIVPGLTLGALLSSLHKDQVSRDENAFVALPDIQRVVGRGKRQTLFHSLFVFENYPKIPSMSLFEKDNRSILKAENVATDEQSNYPLSLMISAFDRLEIVVRYHADHYDDTSVEKLVAHLKVVLHEFAKFDPTLPVCDVITISKTEEQKLLSEWSHSGSHSWDARFLHQIIEDRAFDVPAAIAVSQGSLQIDYQTLNARANRLAHHLSANGVGPDTIVGICVNRSIEMIIALLGILKAGGAFLPLDANDAAERLKLMMAECSLAFCVVDVEAIDRLPLEGLDLVIMEGAATDSEWLAEYSDANLDPDSLSLQKNHLAYVIFTSGSTGTPKGVMVEHRNLLHYAMQAADRYITDGIAGSVVSSTLAFDATITSILPSLIRGLTLHLTKADDHDLASLCSVLGSASSPLLFKLTPSHLDAMSAYHPQGSISSMSHHMVIGGEQWWSSSALEWAALLPYSRFSNEYGPTETVVGCCVYEFAASDAASLLSGSQSVPIGRPIADTQLYVLSSDLKLVPPGCIGELYIGGKGVARGYIGREDATRKRFIADPFASGDDARLYKTGDMVHFLPDGQLVFNGRNDDQVKIRGHRVELGEVEAALRSICGVREAVVVVKELNRQSRLFAFVAGDFSDLSSEGLLARLSHTLPSHMVPAALSVLDTIPLTGNGKVDRRSLEQMCGEPQDRIQLEPTTEAEAALCEIWQSVLGLAKVGVKDNFFEIGGDSILSIQISARAKARGIPVTVQQIFELQTIAAIAPRVAPKSIDLSDRKLAVGSQTLLPIQKQYLSEQKCDPHHFNQSVMLEAPLGFDMPMLLMLVDLLHKRHDVLRLRFKPGRKGWTARYAESSEVGAEGSAHHFDLSGSAADERAAMLRDRCDELQRSLDIENGPIFRAAFFDFGPEESGRVLLIIHHLAVDGVSWRLMIDELNVALAQLQDGQALDLGVRPPTYKIWGKRASTFAASSSLAREAQFWLSQVQTAARPSWVEPDAAQECEFIIEHFELSADETEFLLGRAHEAYRTKGHELLLAALYCSLSAWYDPDRVLLFLEGHGRDAVFEESDFDASQTVGWFTCIYPLAVELGRSSDLGCVIKATKEGCRSVPNGGIGYGLLVELARETRLTSLDCEARSASLRFNYLGQIDGTNSNASGFKLASEPVGNTRSNGQRSIEPAAVNVVVSKKRMAFHLSCDNGRVPKAKLAQLARAYRQNIAEIVAHCRMELDLRDLSLAGKEIVYDGGLTDREDEVEI